MENKQCDIKQLRLVRKLPRSPKCFKKVDNSAIKKPNRPKTQTQKFSGLKRIKLPPKTPINNLINNIDKESAFNFNMQYNQLYTQSRQLTILQLENQRLKQHLKIQELQQNNQINQIDDNSSRTVTDDEMMEIFKNKKLASEQCNLNKIQDELNETISDKKRTFRR